jgi:uncharacterized membrane protein YcaP (DUF421 family)
MIYELPWSDLFVPTMGLLEIITRGTLIYLTLFLIFRFIARRQSGSFGPADLLVIVLIADASQNALGKDYNSITEGIALVLTIVGWEYLIDWIAWKFPKSRNFLIVPPLNLIENGKVIQTNLDRELLTHGELLSQLRLKGIEDLHSIKLASLEGDGQLSVIQHGPNGKPEL